MTSRFSGSLRVVGAVAIVAVVATACLDACSSKACTAAGCVDGVTAQIEVPASVPSDSRLTVCRGDACTEYFLSDPSCPLTSDASTPPTPEIFCSLYHGDAAGAVLYVQYVEQSYAPPVDGEMFTYRLRDRSGAVVFERSVAVTYKDFYPNGPSCGGACKYAHVE